MAAKVIQTATRYRQYMKKSGIHLRLKKKSQLLYSFKMAVRKFRKHRKFLDNKFEETPVEDLLFRINHQMTTNFDKMLSEVRRVKDILGNINKASKNEDKLHHLMESTHCLNE